MAAATSPLFYQRDLKNLPMPKVGLIGCCKTKLGFPAPARDLYVSRLFQLRRMWVERECDQYFILSAEHGLLDPSAIVEPYDRYIVKVPASERREWAAMVFEQIKERFGDLRGFVFDFHAGRFFLDFGLRDALEAEGATIEYPMRGLTWGYAKQAYTAANHRSRIDRWTRMRDRPKQG